MYNNGNQTNLRTKTATTSKIYLKFDVALTVVMTGNEAKRLDCRLMTFKKESREFLFFLQFKEVSCLRYHFMSNRIIPTMCSYK